MKKLGFVKSDKENEKRICLVPRDIKNIKNKEYIYLEEGYGKDLDISDDEYKSMGVNIVTREEAMNMDIIVDPKIGDAKYLEQLKNKTVFGWIHAVQNRDITDIFVNNNLTGYAWEDMFELGEHSFWRNNEVAGEAAVMHALLIHGTMPYDKKAAIIGNGNTSRGAYKILTQLGCKVKIYNRRMEKLLQKELNEYDIIVNAVLWDVNRKDYIIYKEDLKRMKPGSLIIDISCDHDGAIESSKPTSIENPSFIIDSIEHYAVDHTPSLVYRTVSEELSSVVSKYVDYLIMEENNTVLNECKIIDNGVIIDERIKIFQNRE